MPTIASTMPPHGKTIRPTSPNRISTIARMMMGAIHGAFPLAVAAKRWRMERAGRDVQTCRQMRREWLRYAGPAVFAVGSILMLALQGVPTAKDRLFAWLLLGVFAVLPLDARRLLPRLVLEWSPFILFLLA